MKRKRVWVVTMGQVSLKGLKVFDLVDYNTRQSVIATTSDPPMGKPGELYFTSSFFLPSQPTQMEVASCHFLVEVYPLIGSEFQLRCLVMKSLFTIQRQINSSWKVWQMESKTIDDGQGFLPLARLLFTLFRSSVLILIARATPTELTTHSSISQIFK